MSLEGVVVLDLDGVILQSNLIKHQAMLSLFEGAPVHREAVSTYILANGGVPRREKIAAILREILAVPDTPEVLSHYLARYAVRLESLLAIAPIVEGIAEFVQNQAFAFYVCSSAPEAEIETQLVRTGLLRYFTAVFGSTTTKANALLHIRQQEIGARPVFFGDSIGDLRAAKEAGVAFIAVTSERDNFIEQEVIKLKDFSSLERVQRCMQAALLEGAT
jgi:phosphoglycolate phosphatase-like HAD superfamily hydrolase